MIFNEHLERLLEVRVVKDFMVSRRLEATKFHDDAVSSLLLFRDAFVIEVRDALRENYLEIFLVDLDSDRVLEGGAAVGCSVDLGFQNLEEMRAKNHSVQTWESLFLSFEIEKMNNLQHHLAAFDRLFPLIETEGLRRLQNSGRKYPTDFPLSIRPMYPLVKARYAKCLPVRTAGLTHHASPTPPASTG